MGPYYEGDPDIDPPLFYMEVFMPDGGIFFFWTGAENDGSILIDPAAAGEVAIKFVRYELTSDGIREISNGTAYDEIIPCQKTQIKF